MQKLAVKFKGKVLEIFTRGEADESVAAEIFKLEEYRVCEETIKNAGHAILDVGAHAGFFTIYAKVINPGAHVVAVEPEKNNLEFLRMHVEKNILTDVVVVGAALGRETGQGILKISEDSHNHELLAFAKKRLEEDEINVKVYCLGDLLKFSKTKKYSLVKMDIEGGEYEAFAGATEADFANIGAFIMEYHNFGQNNYAWIERKLREHGFGVQIFPSKFDKRMGFLWAVNKRVKI